MSNDALGEVTCPKDELGEVTCRIVSLGEVTCPNCSREFKSAGRLAQHMRTRNCNKPFHCASCNKYFLAKANYLRHLGDHDNVSKTSGKSSTCYQCYNKFPKQTDLTNHIWIEHGGKRIFVCLECNKQFNFKNNWDLHMRSHTGEKPYMCDQCEKTFIDSRSLKRHVSSHTGDKPYSCMSCSKKFFEREALEIHTRRHTGETPYVCSVCNKAFSSKSILYAHERRHAPDRPFECEVCNQTFIFKSFLLLHARVHTGEKPYACTECDMKFIKKSRLDNHRRTHTGEKPYACDQCFNRFALKSTLNKHMHVHDRKSFDCSQCGEKFHKLSDLVVHMKSHPDMGLFVCFRCHKSFPLQSCLERHMQKCVGASTSFVCCQCDVKFAGRKELRLHFKNHNKNLFVCTVCNKTFSNKAGLNKHKRSHAGKMVFSCGECNVEFNTKSDFSRHMKRHVVDDAKEEVKETSDRGEPDDLVIEEQDFSFTKYEEAYVENEKSFVEVSNDVEVPLVMLPMSSEDVSHVEVPLVDAYDMSAEKPFVCRVVCKKSFATIAEMEEYLKTQTDKNMHNCTQCNESFFHEISP